jgi:hypothetical protein
MYAINEEQKEAVRHVQRVLRVDETGDMDGPTKAVLRGMQSLFGLTVSGCLDAQTAEKIEQIRSHYA